MGLKFFGTFYSNKYTNVPMKEYRIEMYDIGFTGTAIEVKFGGSPIVEKEQGTAETGYGLRGCRFTIEILKTTNIGLDDLYVADGFSNLFKLIDVTDSNKVIRTGYLIPEDVKEEYQDGKSIFQITATDGLELLGDVFEIVANKKPRGLMTIFDVIQFCLNKTNLQLNSLYSFPYYHAGSTILPGLNSLKETQINLELLTTKTYTQVLEEIAETLNLSIYQEDGEWCIIHSLGLDSEEQYFQRYDYLGANLTAGSLQQFVNAGFNLPLHPVQGEKRKKRNVKNVTTILDINDNSTNILQNSDFQNGLTGWSELRSNHTIDGYSLGGANTKTDPYYIQIDGYQPKNLLDWKNIGGLSQNGIVVKTAGEDYRTAFDKSYRIKAKIKGRGVEYAFVIVSFRVFTNNSFVPYFDIFVTDTGGVYNMAGDAGVDALLGYANLLKQSIKVKLTDSYGNNKNDYTEINITTQRLLDFMEKKRRFTFSYGVASLLQPRRLAKIELEDITTVELRYTITEGYTRKSPSTTPEWVRWADLSLESVDKSRGVGLKKNKYLSTSDSKSNRNIDKKALFGDYYNPSVFISMKKANGLSTSQWQNLSGGNSGDLLLILNKEIFSINANPPLFYEGAIMGRPKKHQFLKLLNFQFRLLNERWEYNFLEARAESCLYQQSVNAYSGFHSKYGVYTGTEDGKEDILYDGEYPPSIKTDENSMFFDAMDNSTVAEFEKDVFFKDGLLNIQKDANGIATINFYDYTTGEQSQSITATSRGFEFLTPNSPLKVEIEKGTVLTNNLFIQSNDRTYTMTNVYIHRTLGNDALKDADYFGQTSTTGNWFATAEAAWNWCNKLNRQKVAIYFLGTSAADPYVLSTNLRMSDKSEFYMGGSTFDTNVGVAYVTQTSSGLFYGLNCSFNVGAMVINGGHSQGIFYLTSNSSLIFGSVMTINMSATATRVVNLAQALSVTLQGQLTVNFGANNQQVFHNSGNNTAQVWIGNHVNDVALNDNGFTGLKWCTEGNGYVFYTNVINQVGFGAKSFPLISFKGAIFAHGSAMTLRADHSPDRFNFALNLGTTSPLKFVDLNSSSVTASSATDKFLMLDANGKVIVGNAQNVINSGYILDLLPTVTPQTANIHLFGTLGLSFSATSTSPLEIKAIGTAPLNAYLNFPNNINFKLGKIGVGTISPTYGIQVENGGINIKGDNAPSTAMSLGVGLILGSQFSGAIHNRISSFSITTANTFERLHINGSEIAINNLTNGKVAIGTDITDTDSKLIVNGKIRQTAVLSSLLATNATGQLVAATATDVSPLIDPVFSNYWTKTGVNLGYTLGSVGVGVLSPATKLEVSDTGLNVSLRVNSANSGISTNNYSEIQLADNSTVRSFWRNSRDGTGAILFGYNDHIRFMASGATERIRFTGLGQIGLNVVPTESIHLGGGANNNIRMDTATGNAGYFGATTDVAYFGINRNGTTGVFAKPTFGAAAIRTASTSAGGNVSIFTSNAVNVSPTEHFRFTNLGELLISPLATPNAYKLQINSGGATGFGLWVKGISLTDQLKVVVGATVGHVLKCTGPDGTAEWQPNTATGADAYQGTWVASATYPSATPTVGQWWRITTGGTFNSVTWVAGSDIYYNGTTWVQRPNAYALTIATATILGGVKIGSGINVDASGLISLANLGTPGTYRSVTVDATGRITAGTNPTTISGYGITDFVANFDSAFATKNTSSLSESVNLYFTNARVLATQLTGFVSGAGVLGASDTILQAFNKLSGNINAINIGTLGAQSQLNGVGFVKANGTTISYDNSVYIKANNTASSGQFLKANSSSQFDWSNLVSGDITDLATNYYNKTQVDALVAGSGTIQTVLTAGNVASNKWLYLNNSSFNSAGLGFRYNGVDKGNLTYDGEFIDRLMLRSTTGQIQIEAAGGFQNIEMYSSGLKINCLVGTGTRMVTVSPTGFLSSQTIPTGSGVTPDLQSVTSQGNSTNQAIFAQQFAISGVGALSSISGITLQGLSGVNLAPGSGSGVGVFMDDNQSLQIQDWRLNFAALYTRNNAGALTDGHTYVFAYNAALNSLVMQKTFQRVIGGFTCLTLN